MRLENSLRVSVTNRRKRTIVKLYAFLRIIMYSLRTYSTGILIYIDGCSDSVHVNARVVDHR